MKRQKLPRFSITFWGRIPDGGSLCDFGYKNDALTLNDREWTCPQCGAHHDRDVLAARNIYRRGIADLESTCKTGFAG